MLSAQTISAMSASDLIQVAPELFDPNTDPLLRAEWTALCRVRALELGATRAFEKLLHDYAGRDAQAERYTEFSWAPLRLRCGKWTATDRGVYGADASGRPVTASRIPILPTAILNNVTTGVESLEITYQKRGVRALVCNRAVVSSTQKIVALADQGVEVTSETARHLVNYLSDCVNLNMNALPHLRATSSLGWLAPDEFAPYSDVKFDAEREYKHLFDAVREKGDLTAWVRFVAPLRENVCMRLMLATSFASVLVEPCGCLPFVLHLWGETGSGKSVSLMVAMSVWGDPEMGKLTRTMNMTANSMMSTAAFLNNLPFAGDELQTIKEKWGNYDDLIMKITEGIDRGRMSYDRLTPTKSWKNAFIFTGEEPCLRNASGGGAKNRVIQAQLKGDLVANGNECANFVRENYGAAGKAFVEHLVSLGWDEVRRRYTELFQRVIKEADTTDKQAMAAALILLGDALADELFWHTGKPLRPEDMREFLFTAREIDVAERAYEFIVQLIAQNPYRFVRGNEQPVNGEVWGKINLDDTVLFNHKVLAEKLREEGYDFEAVKRRWEKAGRILRADPKRLLHQKSVMGVRATFAIIALPPKPPVKPDPDSPVPEWVQEIMEIEEMGE